MTRRTRAIVLLLALLGIAATYIAVMWGFAEWTHKLIYEDGNELAVWLMVGGGLIAAAFYELWTTGEIRWSKTKAWRPKWNKTPPTEASKTVRSTLDLPPSEFRRERQ